MCVCVCDNLRVHVNLEVRANLGAQLPGGGPLPGTLIKKRDGPVENYRKYSDT